MRLMVNLYDVLPEQMALFKEAHPHCVHVPLFCCGDEIWPKPAPFWYVETHDGEKKAFLEIPDGSEA